MPSNNLRTQQVGTVETLMSSHPWDGKEVSVTGDDGGLRECKNTEFV